MTGPDGPKQWQGSGVDILADAILSEQGVLVFTAERTGDGMTYAIRCGGQPGPIPSVGRAFLDPKNETGSGLLPFHPRDEFPETSPFGWLRASALGSLPILAGWEDSRRLRGILRASWNSWLGDIQINVPYVWVIPGE
ncbi:MAG: hypothetical protein U0Q16_01700 [Bryobacteraceae bacterium]